MLETVADSKFYIIYFTGGDTVYMTALLELHRDALCDTSKPVSSSALVQALTAEYVIEKANNNDTSLAVPSVKYGMSNGSFLLFQVYSYTTYKIHLVSFSLSSHNI